MPPFVIKKFPRGSQKKPLIVVVGKSVSKKAVERNKIKRRMRAITAPFLKRADCDYVIVCRPGITKLSFGELKEEIMQKIYDLRIR